MEAIAQTPPTVDAGTFLTIDQFLSLAKDDSFDTPSPFSWAPNLKVTWIVKYIIRSHIDKYQHASEIDFDVTVGGVYFCKATARRIRGTDTLEWKYS